jgi:hypothetical protein
LRGAAVYVLERMGQKVEPLPAAGPVFRPKPSTTVLYAEARAAQAALETTLAGSFSNHQHPGVQKRRRSP